jgi:hypothetical protein
MWPALVKAWELLKATPAWVYAAVVAAVSTALFAGHRRFSHTREIAIRRITVDLEAQQSKNKLDLEQIEAERIARQTFDEEAEDIRELEARINAASDEELIAILKQGDE